VETEMVSHSVDASIFNGIFLVIDVAGCITILSYKLLTWCC